MRQKTASPVARRKSGDDFSGADDRPQPTRRIGKQMVEVIRQHQPLSRREAQQKAITLLEEMQIPDAGEVMERYPFELSGGCASG
jgi:ABC-type microcin C transport system duplicated ATPase subunit YejF